MTNFLTILVIALIAISVLCFFVLRHTNQLPQPGNIGADESVKECVCQTTNDPGYTCECDPCSCKKE